MAVNYRKLISDDAVYQLWINEHEKKNREGIQIPETVKFSVVVPVYNVEDELLAECIESVQNQTYGNWELILVDDCSPWESVRKVMRSYEADPRIKCIYRSENGHISEATNDGIKASTGDFIAFMDCDDVLSVDALYEAAKVLNEHPETDFIYSDEDKLSEDGRYRRQPFFKPDFSPDTYMAVNYTNHLSIFRASLTKETGGLRTEMNGSQDYDFTLRFMELSDNKRVQHISKVLYYWRERKGSVADTMGAKPYTVKATERLKTEALRRRGWSGRLNYLEDSFQFAVEYETPGNPRVSIVIPSKDNPTVLKKCIQTLTDYTTYHNYEIILVDNGSNAENKKTIEGFIANMPVRYIYRPMEFNFSTMCNIGAAEAKGDYILLLNDDIEIPKENGRWLSILLGQAMLPHAGAVGIKLYYPNSVRIQHCGVINLPVGPSHAFCMANDIQSMYFGRNRLPYNYLAVTGACLLVKKALYDQLGGLDEELRVGYNDVDFCFSLYEAGYYNVARNDIFLYHHESISRGSDVNPEKAARLDHEREVFYGKHPALAHTDPFYNVNLIDNQLDFSIKVDEGALASGEYHWEKKEPGKRKDFPVSVDEIKIQDTVLIKGWASMQDKAWDDKGEMTLLLRLPGGAVLRFPVRKSTRRDVQAAIGCESENVGYLCVFPREVLFFDDVQIGIAFSKGWRTYYNLTDHFIRIPDYLDPVIKEISAEDYAAIPQGNPMVVTEKNEVMGRQLSMKGWAFDPTTYYNVARHLSVLITDEERYYICQVKRQARWDVSENHDAVPNILYSGFLLDITLPEGFNPAAMKQYLVMEEMDTRVKYHMPLPAPMLWDELSEEDEEEAIPTASSETGENHAANTEKGDAAKTEENDAVETGTAKAEPVKAEDEEAAKMIQSEEDDVNQTETSTAETELIDETTVSKDTDKQSK